LPVVVVAEQWLEEEVVQLMLVTDDVQDPVSVDEWYFVAELAVVPGYSVELGMLK
jgi:hypothetical protein